MANGPEHNLHRTWDHSDTPADELTAYEGVPDPNEMPPARGMDVRLRDEYASA